MNLLSLIGNTPIVPLRRLASPEGGAIFAKLEAMNPGGSVKDRPALNMIEAGEEIKPGKTGKSTLTPCPPP